MGRSGKLFKHQYGGCSFYIFLAPIYKMPWLFSIKFDHNVCDCEDQQDNLGFWVISKK